MDHRQHSQRGSFRSHRRSTTATTSTSNASASASSSSSIRRDRRMFSDSTTRSRPDSAYYSICSASSSSKSARSGSVRSSRASTSSFGHPTGRSSRTREGEDGENVVAIRSSKLRLPLRLPRPEGLVPVDITTLPMPESLSAYPPAFLLSKLSSLGPSLLNSSTQSTILLPSSTTSLPASVRVRVPPLKFDSQGLPLEMPLPTHVFAIKGNRTERTLLLPVHGLVYSTNCHVLKNLVSSLSSTKDFDATHNGQGLLTPPHSPALPTSSSPDERIVTLPVIQINLPNGQSFPLLHRFLTCPSLPNLLSSLLPSLPPPAPTRNPSSIPINSLLNPTAQTLASHLASTVDPGRLVKRLEVIHGLWQDVVSLGVGNEQVWKGLEVAWAVGVGALALGGRKQGARS